MVQNGRFAKHLEEFEELSLESLLKINSFIKELTTVCVCVCACVCLCVPCQIASSMLPHFFPSAATDFNYTTYVLSVKRPPKVHLVDKSFSKMTQIRHHKILRNNK